MSVLDQAKDIARTRNLRVVFPEWDESRVAEAAHTLAQEALCQPLPLAEPDAAQMSALVEARGIKEGVARRMLSKPLIRAAAMVAAGQADVMVAGVDAPTRRVIEAAGLAIGLAEGVSAPSSCFLMQFPDGRDFIFADCAVNVSPDAVTLAGIARASSATGKALLGDARTALLSFSTGASGAGSSVDMVAEVAQATGFAGPIQADAALNAAIAAKKGIDAPDANVLIFPSLDAGNIAYKLCQELGGAQAIGPLLQGFRKPVCDLSRGARVSDIIAATVLTIAMASDG